MLRGMKHLIWILALAACGGASQSGSTTPGGGGGDGKVVGPPEVAWKDMTHEQQAKFMGAVVMPKFKPMFQSFDPKAFAEFNCHTCHGQGSVDKTFKMPNPAIYVLPEAPEDFQKLGTSKPGWMKLMPQVEEEMAKTLGMKPYDPAAPDPSQFGCYGCHTHKAGGAGDL
jgi:hypothetical protein